MFGNVSGQVGKMKIEVAHQQTRKQIMQNSFEQAKSRRHLTVNVETKRFSDLHENVNPAIIDKRETQHLMFSDLHENANSALRQNLNVPSGTLPEPRKRHLPLPRPLSIDAFCEQMAPHIFKNPREPLHIFTHPDMPSRTPTHSVDPCGTLWKPVDLWDKDMDPRSLGARLRPTTNGLDNTVGHVPKILGNVFNTLQTNSAAHVLNNNMNPINEDTHFCDPNLYETIFQNWCIIESLNSMKPTRKLIVSPLQMPTVSMER